jgi:Kef-type K+ transport system membrane component KefB
MVAAAVVVTMIGKIASGTLAGVVGGFTRRQGFNAGVALIAHGEFTVILAQLAAENDAIPRGEQVELVCGP